MANNYTESSSKLHFKKEDAERATVIIDREISKIEEDEGWCGVDATVEEDGVWFCGDETVNAEHLAQIAQALLDELEIDEPFIFSWCYRCSKTRIDAFGGGACAMSRGEEPFWIDAMSMAEEHASRFLK